MNHSLKKLLKALWSLTDWIRRPLKRKLQGVILDALSPLQVNFRSIAYDRASVEQDLAAAGLSVDLLRVPPVPHPLLDPGLETLASA